MRLLFSLSISFPLLYTLSVSGYPLETSNVLPFVASRYDTCRYAMQHVRHRVVTNTASRHSLKNHSISYILLFWLAPAPVPLYALLVLLNL